MEQREKGQVKGTGQTSQAGKARAPVLRVRMFGGFEMEYDGQPVVFSRGSGAKAIQLLSLLFLNYPQGLGKANLIESIYDTETEANHNKNLNSVIYRLKKQFLTVGFPDEEYIVLKGGKCLWESSFPVEVDTLLFESHVREAFALAGTERLDRLKAAERLYAGELLPGLNTELWVIERSLSYKKLYNQMVEELGKSLEAAGDFDDAYLLFKKAARLYPYEMWQEREMDSLISAKKYQTAYEVYQDTAKFYCEDMGLPPGEGMIQRLKLMEGQMTNPVSGFDEIRGNLAETERQGAYYCYYPSFLDSCRILARMAERSGQSIFLMLLNLIGKSGREFSSQEKLEFQMAGLKNAIQNSLRRGDLYTRYSRSQFLIILLGTTQESCPVVFERIRRHYQRERGQSGILSFSISSLLNIVNPGLVAQEEKPDWGKKFKKWKS